MVCRSWLLLSENRWAEAIRKLPSDIEHIQEYLSEDEPISMRWTYICITKAVFIKGR